MYSLPFLSIGVSMAVLEQKYPGRRKALLKQMHEELERTHGVRDMDVFS